MCSGLRDGAALAWRLDLVLRGLCEPTLVDSYMKERRPHVRQLTLNAAERGQQFWLTDPDKARLRDARLRELAVSENLRKGYGAMPSLSDGFLMKGEEGPVAPAGRLSPQFKVQHGEQELLLDDHTGAQWTLLSIDAQLVEALRSDEQELMQRLNAHIIVLDQGETGSGFRDVQGNYFRWMNELGCRLLLVRPDCYVFGGASGVVDMRALFASLRDQLHLKNLEFA